MKIKIAGYGLLAIMAVAGLGTSSMLAQEGPPPPPPEWRVPPPEYREVARMGFLDGIEGARRDFQNHRAPDVNNRDEFRHPHVPWRDREDYRHGFERGYRVGVAHIYGGGYGGGYGRY